MPYTLKKSKARSRGVENLSARVYSQIKNLILSNEVLPGQKLHHQELSERLGVSRTPVREALTRLVQEGNIPFLNQASKRFAHRSSAYAEPLTEFLVMKLLAGQDFIGQDQIFDLTINPGGKILDSARAGLGFFERIGHEKKFA